MVPARVTLVASILRSARAFFRRREAQAIVELALRQQLAVYVHKHPKPRLSPLDRAFWVALSRVWPQWRSALVLVRPETVIRWHRKAFRGYWRWISKPGPGRPPISEETKALIVRMATENRWRARTIQKELAKLGIHLGETTIARYAQAIRIRGRGGNVGVSGLDADGVIDQLGAAVAASGGGKAISFSSSFHQSGSIRTTKRYPSVVFPRAGSGRRARIPGRPTSTSMETRHDDDPCG